MTEHARAQRLIGLELDGELTEPERCELDAHLAECEDCRRVRDAFEAISLSLNETEAPTGFAGDVMRGIDRRRYKRSGKIIRLLPRVAAYAACVALLLVAASNFGLLGRAPEAATSGREAVRFFAMSGGADTGDALEPEPNDLETAGTNDLETALLTDAPMACPAMGKMDVGSIDGAEVCAVGDGAATKACAVLDADEAARLMELLQYAGETEYVAEGDGDYRIELVSEAPQHGLSVWLTDEGMICRDDGFMQPYLASGDADEFLALIS